MEKRGQENILTTVLLVAIFIVAFLIVFNIVKPLVTQNSGSIETEFNDYLQMLFEPPPVSNGLIAYYKFEGNANDELGIHNGTVYGVEFVDDPQKGMVANFSLGDYINAGSPSWLPVGNMAISVWVYARSWGGESVGRILVSHDGQRFYLDGSGSTRLTFSSNDGGKKAHSAQNMVLGQWKHLVINRIGDNIYFYINGVKSDASDANGGTPILAGDYVIIGSDPDPYTRTFDGYIDNLMVFNRNLSEQEILSLFNWNPQGCNGNICSCEDLQNMSNCLNCDYTLGNNIDCINTINWDNGKGFLPIGYSGEDSSLNKFIGNLNGQNHTISNLYINRSDGLRVGLFGTIGDLGSIRNLNLIDVNIVGDLKTGGLAGVVSGGNSSISNVVRVANISVSGDVKSMGDDSGGLIGDMENAIVTNCHADVQVSGTSKVGGLIGEVSFPPGYAEYRVTGELTPDATGDYVYVGEYNDTSWGQNSIHPYYKHISKNFWIYKALTYHGQNPSGGRYTVNIWAITNEELSQGTNYWLLMSENILGSYSPGGESSSGTATVSEIERNITNVTMQIINSSADGNVIGSGDLVGGLVGENQADITNAHATGNVNGNRYVGGLIGYQTWSDLLNVYSEGDVKGSDSIGGAIGKFSSANVSNCSWLSHPGNPSVGVGSGNQVCSAIAAPFNSNLPIVLIDTFGATILNEPKIPANLTIIYDERGRRNFITDAPNYLGRIGIELRGQISQTAFPDKSYAFETKAWNGTNYTSFDVSLLGFPSENDWVLKGDWFDRTSLRNVVTYNLSNEIGRYATRTKALELFMKNFTTGNYDYNGVYTFMEKIKRDDNRVNIAKLDPNEISGDDVTGGYILSVDKNDYLVQTLPSDYFYTSNRNASGAIVNTPTNDSDIINTPLNGTIVYFGTRYLYNYPDADTIVQQQKDYIKNYAIEFEANLSGPNFADPVNGYAKYIDVDSFIDYLILVEFTKNTDALKTSTYFYKDKLGKITMGPVWDYDLAYGNMGYWGGPSETGWQYQFTAGASDYRKVPFWWKRLMEDSAFKKKFQDRWFELRADTLSLKNVFGIIDAKANEKNEAMQRHFAKWDTLNKEDTCHTACGTVNLTWSSFPRGWNMQDPYCTVNPINVTVTLCPKYWEGEIQMMKEYLIVRTKWVDDNILVVNWTAYNDLNGNVASYPKITNITSRGKTSQIDSGFLKNYATGAALGVNLTVSNVIGTSSWDTIGAMPGSGTEAYTLFYGKLNAAGMLAYNDADGASEHYFNFAGLNPTKKYRFALLANRGNSSYADRNSTVIIQGADSFQADSSIGANVTRSTKTIDDDSVTYPTGYNVKGYVAAWTYINPGSDGGFFINVTGDYPYSNAIMLQELA